MGAAAHFPSQPGSSAAAVALPLARWRNGRKLASLVCAGWLLATTPASAITLGELLTDPKMTPKRFANHFENFDYEFSAAVLPAEVFLEQQRGDCDDYAILGDYVLNRHNFSTRLIRVNLVGRVAHGVCYVSEAGAYLDYNNRKFFRPLQRSGRTLREIATEVAKSFEANWTTASEYTYDYSEDKKRFVATVVKTDPASKDPPLGGGRPDRRQGSGPWAPLPGWTAPDGTLAPGRSRYFA